MVNYISSAGKTFKKGGGGGGGEGRCDSKLMVMIIVSIILVVGTWMHERTSTCYSQCHETYSMWHYFNTIIFQGLCMQLMVNTKLN